MTTGLEGSIQHRFTEGVEKLNDAYYALHERLENVKGTTMRRIGELVDPLVEYDCYDITFDGYEWFAKLAFTNGVVVLFPYLKDERPVFFHRDVNKFPSEKDVKGLLEKLTEAIANYPKKIERNLHLQK